MAQQTEDPRLVDVRPRGPAHHLDDVADGVVHPAILPAVELLGVHDNHQVGRHGHAPRQLLGRHQHLDGTRLEQPLDHPSLRLREPFVVEADTEFKRLLEGLLPGAFDLVGHDVVRHVQEPLWLVVSGSLQQQVDRRQPALLPVSHKDDDRFVGRLGLDGLVDGLAHCQQAAAAVVHVEAVDGDFQGDSADVGAKVEEVGAARADPLSHILGVGQRACQSEYADRLVRLGGDVPHTRHAHLHRRADFGVQQLQLVRNEQPQLRRHLLASPPS
mmetsp:Transcript_38642/g.96752  ORF Transcript_38642/g.96752 Transcript_38642/m.96752 type:complete len:272 (+) Transcript_38642:1572-2387(+)